MSFPAYPRYRDSGTEWLGHVPAHWSVDRIKASVESARNGIWGGEPEEADEDIVCVRVADFDRVRFLASIDAPTMRKVTEKEREGRQLQRGDLLLEKSGGGEKQPVGAVVQYAEDVPAVCSNFVARVQLKSGMHSRYWTYVHAAAYSIRLTQGSINQTSGIQNLDSGRYFEERAPFPPLPEQTAIGAFLDRETAKIDALVEEQRRLIELLKEKRQAIISHAVTKGLDPTVPMKDSGVEWLGQVPAHWELSRLDRLMSFVSGKAHEPYLDDEGEHVYISARFVSTQGERFKLCTENLTPAKRGEVVMVMSDLPNGRALARAYQIPDDASYAVNQRVCRLNEFQGSARYFYYQLDRNPGLLRYDDGVNQTHLSNSAYCKLSLCAPPKREQEEIAQFLDGVTKRLDALQEAANVAVGVLQERRAALISAAVTGKIDVREVAMRRAEAA